MAINVDNVSTFKFIAHKVMPLVYDESLSYYEFLCKVMQKLNEVIESNNNQNDILTDFDNEITTFENNTDAKYDLFVDNVNALIDAFTVSETEARETFEAQMEESQTSFEDEMEHNLSEFSQSVNHQIESFTESMDEKWNEFFDTYIQTLGVVQDRGNSTTYVMSQKGTTDALDDIQKSVNVFCEAVNENVGSDEIDETLNENTTKDIKITGVYKVNKVYKIKITFNNVTWNSNGSQFLKISSYSANSISSTYEVDSIRLATEHVYNDLDIIYIPSTDTSVMVGFKFYLGAGTQDIDIEISDSYSQVSEDVKALQEEAVNILPEVEKSENEISGTISGSFASYFKPYHFIKGNTYKLYLKCVLGTESTTNVLRITTASAPSTTTQYRKDIINSSTALNPLCGVIDNFATGDEIVESFVATKNADYLTLLYYGNDTTNYQIDVDIVRIASVEEIDNIMLGNGVVNLNKDIEPYLLQLSREISTPTVNHNYNRLNFIFFSDIHARAELWERICDYMDYYSDIIPFAIHGGDYVSNNLSASSIVDLYGLRKPINGAILNTVGNHDCYPADDDHHTADAETVYGVLYDSVDPDEDGWNCTFGDEPYSMYWYKDIAEAGVRIICLDQYHWNSEQDTFFVNALAGAKTNGYGVITVVHTPITTDVDDVGTGFWTLDNWVVNDTHTGAMVTIRSDIDTFVSNGGLFLIHLCGHIHSDQFGLTNNDNLLQFRTQMAGNSELWTDTKRVYGSKTYDCFNVIQIDRNLGMIKILRVGCNTSDCLQPRTVLCYDYVNNKVIANK